MMVRERVARATDGHALALSTSLQTPPALVQDGRSLPSALGLRSAPASGAQARMFLEESMRLNDGDEAPDEPSLRLEALRRTHEHPSGASIRVPHLSGMHLCMDLTLCVGPGDVLRPSAACLHRVLCLLLTRHAALRTTYTIDSELGLLQRVRMPPSNRLSVHSLGGLASSTSNAVASGSRDFPLHWIPSSGAAASAVDRAVLSFFRRRWDLGHDWMVRACVVSSQLPGASSQPLAPGDRLLLAFHHVAVDGTGRGIFFREMSALMAALHPEGVPCNCAQLSDEHREGACAMPLASLPPLQLSFMDLSVWESVLLRACRADESGSSRSFWASEVAALAAKRAGEILLVRALAEGSEMPAEGTAASAAAGPLWAEYSMSVPTATARALANWAAMKPNKTSWFSVFLALWGVFFQRVAQAKGKAAASSQVSSSALPSPHTLLLAGLVTNRHQRRASMHSRQQHAHEQASYGSIPRCHFRMW
jgi:hypothetical protein